MIEYRILRLSNDVPAIGLESIFDRRFYRLRVMCPVCDVALIATRNRVDGTYACDYCSRKFTSLDDLAQFPAWDPRTSERYVSMNDWLASWLHIDASQITVCWTDK